MNTPNKPTLNEKMRGALVGFALGDALGYGTEFMTRQEVQSYYPKGLKDFNQFIKDAHRCMRDHGEWGIETEMLMNLLECVVENKGFSIEQVAKAYKRLLLEADCQIPGILTLICKTPGWEERPVATAHKVWHERGITEASNEALPRALVTGMLSTEKDLRENTRKIVLMTNDDTRCVATAMIMAQMVHSLLYDGHPADYNELAKIGCSIDPRTSDYIEKAYLDNIGQLRIDDENSQFSARKSAAAALWGLWHGKNAPDTIYNVINLGGDSDTNGALAGALAGLRYGYEALPDQKENIAGIDKLLKLADRISEYIQNERND